MSSFPCKIIEADLDADIVTLQMEGDYTVSAGQKYLCDAAAASAEPVAAPKGWRLVPVSPTKEMLLAGETDEYDTAIWWDLMLAAAPAAPVTVQPDLTQQTLDDVKAGIPARDAEIEALRKEIEALRTQQSADKVSALPPLNDDLIAILGRPNFLCAQLADTLRSGGQEIAKRAENEQAAVIHFLLGHYLADPVQWAEKASAALKAARKEQA